MFKVKGKFSLILLMVAVFIVALAVTGCNGEDENGVVDPVEDNGQDIADVATDDLEDDEGDQAEDAIFTLEELADYDGQDGNRAYIAVDGVVYDVTDVPQWEGAEHFGFYAGIDASEALRNSAPHGASLLNDAVIVGSIAE